MAVFRSTLQSLRSDPVGPPRCQPSITALKEMLNYHRQTEMMVIVRLILEIYYEQTIHCLSMNNDLLKSYN